MSYEFLNTLHSTPDSMMNAVAEHFLWLEDDEERHAVMRKAFAEQGDAELADECIDLLGLDEPDRDPALGWNEEPPSWLEAREVDRDDLIAAFDRLRESFNESAST